MAWSQQARVQASNPGLGDLAVGSDLERSNATGIDGNQSNESLVFARAVYLYE